MDRQAQYLWMKHLLSRLEHYDVERRQSAGPSEQRLAQTMERDMGQFVRLCHSWRRDSLAGALA